MAAIPDAGGARYAPRVVMRVLLRVVLLSGLVAVAWLLGSGISHADEDLGQPGIGLIHLVNAGSADDGSGEGFGTPAALGSAVTRVLPTATAPRLSVQPPAQLHILRPIVETAGIAKPLNQALQASRPLSVPAQHTVPAQRTDALPTPAPAEKPAALLTAAPIMAGMSNPAAPELTPVVHASPAVRCSAQTTAGQPPGHSTTVQPVLDDGPVSPIPTSPPGNTTSLCTIGGTGGGANSKNGSDFAVPNGLVTGVLAQPDGPLATDTSEFPLALAVQPSTSPD